MTYSENLRLFFNLWIIAFIVPYIISYFRNTKMECLCELFPYIRQTVCLIGVFVTDNSCNIGIAALFAMSLLHLLWSSEERISEYARLMYLRH